MEDGPHNEYNGIENLGYNSDKIMKEFETT